MTTTTGRPFRFNPLAACVALAFPLGHGMAAAQSTFSADGSYSVGADASAGLSQPKSGGFAFAPVAGPAGGSAVGSATTRFDSSVAVSAASLGDGHFGGAAMTSEFYGSTSPMQTSVKMVYADTIVNTSGAAQTASFTIGISSLQFMFDYGSRVGSNRVSFAANVYANGSSAPLWSTAFSYQNGLPSFSSSGPGTYTASGVDIGLAAALPSSCSYSYSSGPQECAFGSGGFGISNYLTTVSLGTVADSASVDVRYEVQLMTETDMYGGDASVTFNDPSLLSSGGPFAGQLSFDVGAVAAVPEPESALLMAAGLGALALVRRRRGR
jgi:hypothetical protein